MASGRGATDALRHPTVHRTAPTTENSAPSVNSAEVDDKLCYQVTPSTWEGTGNWDYHIDFEPMLTLECLLVYKIIIELFKSNDGSAFPSTRRPAQSRAPLRLTPDLSHPRAPGQVQTRECIEDVIRFAFEERLFLLADEVLAGRPQGGGGGRRSWEIPEFCSLDRQVPAL